MEGELQDEVVRAAMRALLEECRRHLHLHDEEYHHRTPPGLYERIEDMLRRL